MTKKLLQPTSLLECVDHLNDEVYGPYGKSNATLELLRNPLTRDYDNQFERMGAYTEYSRQINLINQVPRMHGMHNFISLVQTAGQAAIAVALNAGDGMVLKITDSSYLKNAAEIAPLQLPPIYREAVDSVVIEIFPWVNRHDIGLAEVDRIIHALEKLGWQFKRGDARPDNVGMLPNGKLVVLDGDALERIPGSNIGPKEEQRIRETWLEEVHKDFYPLYTDPAYAAGEKPLITENPDFTEHFSPLIEKRRDKIHTQPPRPNEGFFTSWFGSKKPAAEKNEGRS
jgi:hypothetical protein